MTKLILRSEACNTRSKKNSKSPNGFPLYTISLKCGSSQPFGLYYCIGNNMKFIGEDIKEVKRIAAPIGLPK